MARRRLRGLAPGVARACGWNRPGVACAPAGRDRRRTFRRTRRRRHAAARRTGRPASHRRRRRVSDGGGKLGDRMLLAINANNTNTVFAVWDGAKLKGAWRIATDPHRTSDEYVVWLDHLLALEKLSRARLDRAIIASVVPEANFSLRLLCRHYCRTEPLVVGEPHVDLGTKALVDRAEEVGADRLVNTVAAHDRYGGPLIVVDFGTATTFDVVDADGNYCGGVIAPGINLSLQALAMAAAKLPSVPVARTEKVIGTSTVECMQSGIFWG